MSKPALRRKLIDFQREIITLSERLASERQACLEREEALLLELIGALDAFENLFKHLQDKEPELDKPVRRALRSFRAIQRKLLRTLEHRGVERIDLTDGKAVIGLCKVIETRDIPGREAGEILAMVREGYRRGERILRPAEVITVGHQ
jgi:molecular chaperone GrpE (heat shock protein)